MNTSRMLEIAIELATSFAHRMKYTLQIEQLQRDLDSELLRITPAEGWPGKNEGERKLAAERAASDNAGISILRDVLAKTQAMLQAVQVGIDGLEAERRALEWEIRAVLATALSGRQEEQHGNVEQTAFDDAAQAEADTQLDDALSLYLEPEDFPW